MLPFAFFTFLAAGVATVVDVAHPANLPRFPAKKRYDAKPFFFNELISLELPHGLADPHPALLSSGLGEGGGSLPTEGDENREEQKEPHPTVRSTPCDGV